MRWLILLSTLAMLAATPARADCEIDIAALKQDYRLAREDVTEVRGELLSLKGELEEPERRREKLHAWFDSQWVSDGDGVIKPRHRLTPNLVEDTIDWASEMIGIHGTHIRVYKAQLPLNHRLSGFGLEIASTAEHLQARCPSEEVRRIAAWGRKNVDDGKRTHTIREDEIGHHQDRIGYLQILKAILGRIQERMRGS
ncbi:MAG: hypothetical protein ACMVY4_01740 [Minwuia sp.]|uniref:hypothetical protein n=1 Tax=Minwuia sp. TaxID=2493630 RepID=UPI003A8AAD9F